MASYVQWCILSIVYTTVALGVPDAVGYMERKRWLQPKRQEKKNVRMYQVMRCKSKNTT